jgi:hypothetical protein
MLSKQGKRISFRIGITGAMRLSIRIIFYPVSISGVKHYFGLSAKALSVEVPENGSSVPGSAYSEMAYYLFACCCTKRFLKELHKRIRMVCGKGSFNQL